MYKFMEIVSKMNKSTASTSSTTQTMLFVSCTNEKQTQLNQNPQSNLIGHADPFEYTDHDEILFHYVIAVKRWTFTTN